MSQESLPASRLFTTYVTERQLHDAARVVSWDAAIRETVQPGDSVLYIGSDAGVLGMSAARAGAANVLCGANASDELYIDVVAANAQRNGLGEQVRPLPMQNIDDLDLPPQDVIILDIVSSGSFEFPLPDALNGLRRLLKPGGVFMPDEVRQKLALIQGQMEYYGLDFGGDFRIFDQPGDKRLTTSNTYGAPQSLNSGKPWPTEVWASTQVRGLKTAVDGVANALRFEHATRLTRRGPWQRETTSTTHMPLILTLPKPLSIEPYQQYNIAFGPYKPGITNPRRIYINIEPTAGG